MHAVPYFLRHQKRTINGREDGIGISDGDAVGKSKLIMLYWQQMREELRDKGCFYQQLRHYHFDQAQVEVATEVEVEGISGTFTGWICQRLDKANAFNQSLEASKIVALR